MKRSPSRPADRGPARTATATAVGERRERVITVPVDEAGPRPCVLINMAVTADGKIATANRQVSSFGSARDTQNLYRLRSTVDAIVCGAGTLEAEQALLDPGEASYRRARRRRGLPEWPLRIAVSGSGSLSPQARVFEAREAPVLVWTTEQAPAARISRLSAVAWEIWICGERTVDLRRACARLARRWGVRRLLCEGGGALNDAFLRAGLVDELHLTLCPFLVGGREAPTIADGEGVATLAEGRRFRLRSRRRQGDEFFLVYEALRD